MKTSKRLVNFFLALFLIILLFPICLVIAILIKLDSPGPIIFRQKRVGKGGRLFTIFKFRTLFYNARKYQLKPTDSSDARITPVGRILRPVGLDEIPQLINVLKGEMSLVGPRPEMLFIVTNYTPEEKQRLQIKPGITGLWQIFAPKDEPIHKHLQYDLFYIKHQSVKLDCWILFQTLRFLVGARNLSGKLGMHFMLRNLYWMLDA